MKINRSIVNLICELEFIIGNHCYNITSHNCRTGDEGCNIRFPLSVLPTTDADEPAKVRAKLTEDIIYNRVWQGQYKESNIRSMTYRFGANHLLIGDAIIEVLEYLENRYNLDFNELEKAIKKSK